MRIASNNYTESLISQLQKLSSQQAQLQGQVSTGQRITNPSDDPSAVGQVIGNNTEMLQLQQFSRNNDQATAASQTVYSAVSALKSISDRAGEIATLGMGVMSPSDYKGYVTELNQMIDQSLQTLNSKYNGNYIFGGENTGASSFSTTTGANGISGVSYTGTAQATSFRIAENGTISPYTDGTTNNQLAGFVNNLVALRDAMSSQNPGSVQAVQSGLTASENDIIQTVGNIGNVQTELQSQGTMNQARFSALQSQNSQETGSDVAQTVVKLTQAQTAYQAALQSSAKIMNLSLLNYIQ